MPASRCEHLVESAAELFYRDGFNATGIDKILRDAGVAKMTLYRHFCSKDDLILAALRRKDERFRNWLVRTVEGSANDPRQRLLAVFDALEQWFSAPDFHGCMFINAAAEFGDLADPVHAAAAEHKRLVRNYLETLAVAAGAKKPRQLAQQINLLVDGAVVTAHVSGDPSVAKTARAAAEVLIEAALGRVEGEAPSGGSSLMKPPRGSAQTRESALRQKS